MRIERLDLVAFGHFTDHTLDFGGPAASGGDLHLVYGPNEAGKSTTLAAIGELLYGMPHRSSWAFRHDNAVLEIGARLATEAGPLEVRRHKNRLVDGEGRALEPHAIDTHGLGLEEYRARFSLDERTLEKGSDAILEQQGELGAALFSAAAGLADLGARLERAMEPADAFYQPRKRTQIELIALKARLAEIDAELAARDVDTKAWAALRSEADAARERHARQEGLVTELQGEVAALERQLRALSAAERRRRLRARLEGGEALPELPELGAEGALERLGEELLVHARARSELEALEARLAEHGAERDALAVDEPVLARGDAVDALRRERLLVAERRGETPTAREALGRSEHQCRALLRRLELPDDAEPLDVAVPEDVIERLETLARERAALVTARDSDRRELDALGAWARSDEAGSERAGVPQGATSSTPKGVSAGTSSEASLPDTTVLARFVEQLVERAPGIGLEALAARRDDIALAVARALDALRPWRGEAAALIRLATPEPAELAAFESRQSALETRARTLDEEARRHREGMRANDEARSTLAATGLVDDARLAALREERGARLAALREAIGESVPADALLERLVALERSLDALDAAAEARVAHGDALARLRALDAERAALEREGERLRHEHEAHAAKSAALESEVATTASGLGLEDATLAAVSAWLPRREAALLRVEELRDVEAKLGRARADVKAQAERLGGLLAPLLPDTPPATLLACPLEELLPLARESLARLERERERRVRLADERREHAAARDRRQHALEEAEQRLTDWEERWARAHEARPALDGDVETTIGRLTLWRELGREARVLEERRANLATLERALEGFARRAAEVLDALDALDATVSADEPASDPTAAVVALERRLETARRAADTAAALDTKIASARTRRDAARDELAPLARRLESLRECAALEDVAALGTLLERLRERRELEARLEETEADLRDALASDDIDTALASGDAPERDALETTLAARRERLEAERRELLECFSAMKSGERELATLDDNAAVATLQAERANVLHEIETRALDTLRLRLGRLALEAGLNRFRERHRSGMMEHARRAFVALTDGQFEDLRARPDERGRDRLVGVRTDGSVLDTARMSTGTRLQLFLALRVAAWHEYAEKRVPLPFVADDVLESFDERRTAAAFRLMGDMARHGQVIYLTHHRHLVDIARRETTGLRVHELPPRGLPATTRAEAEPAASAGAPA